MEEFFEGLLFLAIAAIVLFLGKVFLYFLDTKTENKPEKYNKN